MHNRISAIRAKIIVAIVSLSFNCSAQDFFIRPAIEYKVYHRTASQSSFSTPYFTISPFTTPFGRIQPIDLGLNAGIKFRNLVHLSLGYFQETCRIGFTVSHFQYDSLNSTYFPGSHSNNYYSFANKIPLTVIIPINKKPEQQKWTPLHSIWLGATLFIQRKEETSIVDFGTIQIDRNTSLSTTSIASPYRSQRLLIQIGYQLSLLKGKRSKFDLTLFYEGNIKPVSFIQSEVVIVDNGRLSRYIFTYERSASGFGIRIGKNIYFKTMREKISDIREAQEGH